MTRYRKRPIEIEAVQWDGGSETANSFLGESYGTDWHYESSESENIVIPTLEGDMHVMVGAWIVRGVKGEFYPVQDEIFRGTYERVESPV